MKNKDQKPYDYDMRYYSAEELEMVSVFEAQLEFYQELKRLRKMYIPLSDSVFQEKLSPQKNKMPEV